MSRSQLAGAAVPSRTQRGVVLHSAEIHQTAQGDGVRARVKLERVGRGFYIGTAEATVSPLGDLQCGAQATLQALEHAVGDVTPVKFDLREVEVFQAFGQGAVLVSLVATIDGQERALVGFSPLIGDAATSAARATLDATNRLLGMG